MTQEEKGLQVVEAVGIEVFSAQERAAIDSQIATAKQYPRDLRRVVDNSVTIVSMDKETAQTCRYAKPVGGRSVTGASVHLARILAQQYGNIRVQQRIKQITDRTIVAEAIAFDLETNYAVSVEARRSIISKSGQRYNDSLIETNAMGVLAIAERNAILKVIPKAITDKVYDAAFRRANGDLDSEQKMLSARKKALDYFLDNYGATEDEVVKLLGLRSVNQIKAEQIADLRGYQQAITDGEYTVNDLFGIKTPTEAPNPFKDDKSKKKKDKAEATTTKAEKKTEDKVETPPAGSKLFD